jgi:inorganic phosphate transporter, PiT family
MSFNVALFLTIAGVLVGFAVAGDSMSGSILGKLVSRTLPGTGILSAIFVSVLMLFILTLLKLPVSLSNCTVGAFVGAALATHSGINTASIIEIVGSWIVVPFVCALLSFVLYEIAHRVERSRSLVSIVRANRIVLALTVFFVSFMLGANNLGLIESFAPAGTSNISIVYVIALLIGVSSALGIATFGKKLAAVVGEKIVGLSQMKTFAAMLSAAIIILFLTAFSIPVSLTQVIIGGMLGAGISRRPWAINSREIGILISGWALVTLVCAGLGYVIASIV